MTKMTKWTVVINFGLAPRDDFVYLEVLADKAIDALGVVEYMLGNATYIDTIRSIKIEKSQ